MSTALSAHVGPTMPTTLPFDVVPSILRHLNSIDDYFTLCSCATVRKEWTDVAQRRLFYQFFVIGQGAPAHFNLCLQFIRTHPHLAHNIRCLIFRQYRSGRPDAPVVPSASILTMSDVLAGIRLVPAIRELHIISARFIGDIVEGVSSLTLTTLHIENVQCIAPRTQPLHLLALNDRWEHVTIADTEWYPRAVVKSPPVRATSVHLTFPSSMRESKEFASQISRLEGVERLMLQDGGHWLSRDIDRMFDQCASTLQSIQLTVNSTQEGEHSICVTYLV